MANCIGYEELSIGDARAVGPTDTALRGGVACAVFYVDPAAGGTVRYRGDAVAPTATAGLPLRPGKSIVVAGEGNVRNARFIAEGGSATVHCLYYDRVDVVDLGLSDDTSTAELLAAVRGLAAAMDGHGRVLRQIRNAVGSLAYDTWRDMPDDTD